MNLVHSHDLKVIANISGIQQASSKHPCPYCHWMSTKGMNVSNSKPAKPAPLRTFGSNRKNRDNWIKDGGHKKRAMDFFNCTELPLITCKDEELVIEKLPPPELHIFIGIFNHIYDAMLENTDLCSYAEKWSNDVGVTRRFCPGKAFVGNHCKRLLVQIDGLLKSRPPRSVHKE